MICCASSDEKPSGSFVNLFPPNPGTKNTVKTGWEGREDFFAVPFNCVVDKEGKLQVGGSLEVYCHGVSVSYPRIQALLMKEGYSSGR